jgi:NADH dehydrogenase FAD-containing subunit
MTLDARIPSGPIQEAWDKACFDMKLVNPSNKRKHNIIVVGSGLAGGSAAASLGELGYNVKDRKSTRHAAHTPSPRKVASTQPRTTPTTERASSACSMTP